MKKFLVAFTPIVVFLAFYFMNLGVEFNFEHFSKAFFLNLSKELEPFSGTCGLLCFLLSCTFVIIWSIIISIEGVPKWLDNLIKKITG